jgi:hypothetical protein
MSHDLGNWKARWVCRKWNCEDDFVAGKDPDEEIVVEGNILTTAGINKLWNLVVGGASDYFNSSNSYIGVGDSTTAENASQTDLQATTNKFRKVVDSGYPQISGNLIRFQATFGSSEANFAWNEAGVFNAATGGTMLNRKVVSLGTKSSGATWSLVVEITIT